MGKVIDYIDIVEGFIIKHKRGKNLTPKEVNAARLLDQWIVNDPNID